MIKRLLKKIINKSLGYFGIQLNISRNKNPSQNKKIALENIRLMSEILRNNHCEWWVSHGTLLGMLREKDFISHDTDIDFSVKAGNLKKTLVFDILKEFKLIQIFGDRLDCLELSFIRNNQKIDLFFVYEEGDNYRHSTFANFADWSYVRYDYIFSKIDLTHGEFLGLRLNIPRNSEMYLREFYGTDWSIPNNNWVYFRDPPNLRKTKLQYCGPLCQAEFLKWLDKCEFSQKVL